MGGTSLQTSMDNMDKLLKELLNCVDAAFAATPNGVACAGG